ncbi:MAG TPA: DUF3237 domain-containing protein [Steroidobacteraceae bacterium]|jgi:hypothetical protein|nr:DUF3237 domain-containing protein [Steroidobacteraceae bacterium]
MKPELSLLLEVRATLAAPIVVGDVPEGARRVVPISGGTFAGPRLRGTLVAGGADWQYLRRDGVMIVEAQYLLRTDDGIIIQVNNHGMRHGPEAVMRRLGAGESVDPAEYYFRAAPRLSAPSGHYDWLNRRMFICSGARYPDAVMLWFYEVS